MKKLEAYTDGNTSLVIENGVNWVATVEWLPRNYYGNTRYRIKLANRYATVKIPRVYLTRGFYQYAEAYADLSEATRAVLNAINEEA